MKIKRLTFEGFKDKSRVVNIKFSENPITILYGRNGCGKTTILKLISAILTKDENMLISENVSKIVIGVDESTDYKEYIIERKTISRDDINNSMNQKYDWDGFNFELSSILFGINRGNSSAIEVQPIQIERFFHHPLGYKYAETLGVEKYSFSEELAMYLQKIDSGRIRNKYSYRKMDFVEKKNITIEKLDMQTVEMLLVNRYNEAETLKSERVQNALFSTLALAIDRGEKSYPVHDISDRFERKLYENQEKLIEALSNAQKNEFQENIISILSKEDKSTIINECKSNPLLLNLINNMIEELEKDEDILESINNLQSIFNEMLGGTKKIVVTNKGVYITFINPNNNHSVANLSSGEKHLLTLLTICMVLGTNRDIIMIDEPELSLNISWKRSILNIIQKIVPQAQIIVATHSSTVANGNIDSWVEVE